MSESTVMLRANLETALTQPELAATLLQRGHQEIPDFQTDVVLEHGNAE